MTKALAHRSSASLGVPLLDKCLPMWDVRERHELFVGASAERAWKVLRALDLNRSPIVKALFWLRTLPGRFKGGGAPPAPSRRSLLEDALSVGWVVLEEVPGRQLTVGAITQPWTPVVSFRGFPGGEFRAFHEPGFVKIVWGIAVSPAGPAASVLSTETRVLATDEVSRRKFRRYWYVFGSFIRLIRWISLRMAREELERGSG